MAKNISPDEIKFIVDVESAKAQQEIHQLTKDTASLKEERKRLQKEQLALIKQGKQESEEYKNLDKRVKELTSSIKANEKKISDYTNRLKLTDMTMSQLRKQSKDLQKQLDNTSKALHPELYKQLEGRLTEVKNRMAELKGTAKGLKDSFKEGGVKGIFSNLLSLDGVKGFIAGSGIMKIFGAAGTAAAEAFRWAFNQVKLFYDFNLEIEDARRLTREFIDVEGTDLTRLSSQLQAVAKQTGQDYKTVLSSVETLMRQFGISAQDAYKAILDGIQAGADLNGTFLQQIQQYAPAFSDAGISVSELVGLITQTRSGIFNEQGMRLIQTATNRIRTMSTATQKALDEIGISSKQLEADLVSGRTSILEAIKLISERISELPQNSREVGEVLKNVFGRTASDEGLKMITMLADINTNMDELKQVTGEYGQLERELVETQAKLNEKMQDTFGIGQGGFKELTTEAEIFIIRGLVMIIDKLTVMRTFFRGLKTEAEWAVKGIGAFFRGLETIINSVAVAARTLANIFSGMGHVLMGMQTFDADMIKKGMNDIRTSADRARKSVRALSSDLPGHSGGGEGGGIRGDNPLPPKKDKETPTGNRAGKGGRNTPALQEEALKAYNKARREDIEQAKLDYQQDLNILNEALAQKRISQEQYNAFVTALEKTHADNLLNIEQQYYDQAQTLQLHDESKRADLLSEQQRNVVTAQQQQTEARIEAERQYYDTVEKLNQQAAAARKLTLQEELDAQLSVLDGYYQAGLERARKAGESDVALTEAYEQAKAAIRAKYAEQQRAEEDQKQQKIFQLRQQYGLVSQQELYKHELEELALHHQEGMLSDEEYEKAKKQMKMQQWKETFDYYQKLFGDAVTALQDAELANVDAKYDAEIEAARQAGEDTTELEQKKANEKLKIQKKYADVNFAISASKIIADTAESIMKALAELGPIAGPIAAALMGVTGAAQLTAANAERQKVKKLTLNGGSGSSSSTQLARVATGLEDGGPIDIRRQQDGKLFHADFDPACRGYVDRPTVIVGEGPRGKSREWVASNAALENPTVSPLIDIIDQAQRKGTIATLDMRKFLLQQQARGLQHGGSIDAQHPSPAAHHPSSTDQQPSAELKRLNDILDRLERDGIPAFVALTDLDAQQKLQQRARHIGSK